MSEEPITTLDLGNGHSYRIGRYGVERITEVERSGQMSYVRWFVVEYDGRQIVKEINGAFVHIVTREKE